MPRAVKNLDISLGLATIPVQLFTATSSQGIGFHLLHTKCGSRIQMRLECPIHGPIPREETVRGFETSKDDYVRFEPEELKALEQASSTALVIDSFVPERAIDPVYFENAYYLGAGKNGERGYRVLVQALEKTHRVAVGTFTWRGKTTPIAIRVHQDGLLLQRLYFAGEVHNAAEIDRGPEQKIRDQERTLAERLISELVRRAQRLQLAYLDVQAPDPPVPLSLRLDVEPPPQVLQTDGRGCQHAPAFHVAGGIAEQQGPFAPRALPRLGATMDPSSTLSSSADFPGAPVIRPTCLRRFRDGTRRVSPVARRVLVTVLSLPPRRRDPPRQPACDGPCCLRPESAGSASRIGSFGATSAFTCVTAR
jgi:Ku protein